MKNIIIIFLKAIIFLIAFSLETIYALFQILTFQARKPHGFLSTAYWNSVHFFFKTKKTAK